MTTPRTIKRREQRKRAKDRPKPSGKSNFLHPEWLTAEMIRSVKRSSVFYAALSRDYRDH